ncbi:hypothetical protein FOZ60_000050 [Perkinsus olseni]|uniref:Uncharacterized protein n=2 Tax=Perkinsus olseni TaxID=32597 RepID=A0A7J6PNG7_PEROL|nr:hypothetical protein FOZ60_000050 [Perkinsus olseni]
MSSPPSPRTIGRSDTTGKAHVEENPAGRSRVTAICPCCCPPRASPTLLCSDIYAWFKTKWRRWWQHSSRGWRKMAGRTAVSEYNFDYYSATPDRRPDSEVFRLTPIFEEGTEGGNDDDDDSTEGDDVDSLGLSVTPALATPPRVDEPDTPLLRYLWSHSSRSWEYSPDRHDTLITLPSSTSRVFDDDEEEEEDIEELQGSAGEAGIGSPDPSC